MFGLEQKWYVYCDDDIIGIKAINNTVQTVIGKDRIKSENAKIIEIMRKCLK